MATTECATWADEGDMANRVRNFDWAATPLGSLDTWPERLRTVVDLMLASRQPAYIAWGPELTSLYNDGYIPILGARHPGALGRPFTAVWSEIWDGYRPIVDAIMAGHAQYSVNEPVALAGRADQPVSWFTYSWTPLRDEAGAVAGFYCTATETTEAILAGAEERRQEEEELRLIADNTPAMIGFIDRTLRYRFVNEATVRFLGRPREEIVGLTLPDVVGEQVYSRLRPRIESALRGETARFDDVAPDKHGPGIPSVTEEQYVPRFGADGAVVGYYFLAVDVTEQRRTEEALRSSEERYRYIVEEATDYAIFASDRENRIASWSPGAAAVFGWRSEEVIGQPIDITFTPEDRAEGVPLQEFTAAREKGRTPNVRWHIRKDGGRIFIEGAAYAIRGRNGEFHGLYKVGQDVTDRRAAEEALRVSEARFRAVADLVPDLLWSNDITGVTTWHNRRWLDYTGQTESDAVGWGWLNVIHPDDRPGTEERFLAGVQEGYSLLHEHRIRRSDGAYRWFLVRAEPVRDQSGAITRWFGSATDIHEVRVAREELEARVAMATAELRRLSRRMLVVQEEERRFLARELHDEIGQALTGLGFQLGTGSGAAETRLAEARRIVQELTEQVRQLSMDLRPAALDGYGLLPALRWHLDRYERQTGIEVDLRHEGMDRRFPPPVEIAAYRVVQEALTNVARHAGSSSVAVLCVADGAVLTVSIQDKGRGFTRSGGSGGSGLSGMRERVELLGGTLTVDAAPGTGVVVTAELPLEDVGATGESP